MNFMTTIGVSGSILNLMERHQHRNKILFITLAVGLVCVVVVLYYWVRPAVRGMLGF